MLEDRLAQQFYADGGSVEQSTFYHHATLGFYLLAGVLARSRGEDLSSAVWSAVERGLDYSLALTQPDGLTPAIGGADDGKPIRMEHLPFWDFRPYQAIGAILFRRPDFKHIATRFHEDALWLLGPSACGEFAALDDQLPPATSVPLPQSGYYVLRTGWTAADDYVCFDCGEQAAGMRTDSVSNSMHGHADCLSIVAWLGGRQVLVDPGLFGYNCGGSWEAHFRETAAHNTAKVDGRDQAKHIRKMAWSHSYRAALDGWTADTAEAWVAGRHDGYARGPSGVVHRRAVWLRAGSYVLVFDEFTGHGEHELTVNYQFAPGALNVDGAGHAIFDQVEVQWASAADWQYATACGGPAPEDGWIAPSLGVRIPAPRLRLRCVSSAPRTSLLTVLAARMSQQGERRIHWAGEDGRGVVVVTGPGFTDVIAASGIADRTLVQTDAWVVACRLGEDGSRTVCRAGGTDARFDDRAVDAIVERHAAVARWLR